MFWEYWDHPSQESCFSGGNITFPVAQQPLKSEGDRVDRVKNSLGRRGEKDGSRMPHMWPGSTLLRRNVELFSSEDRVCLHGRTKVWQMVWTKQLSTR